MVRRENIASKIDLIRKYQTLIAPYSAMTFDDLLKDAEKLGACERFIFIICQCAIDAADMLCKLRNLPRPETMSEGFNRLNDAGIIDAQLCESMTRMVGFRNALSHAYDKFNYAVMRDVLSNHLQDFHRFTRAIDNALGQ